MAVSASDITKLYLAYFGRPPDFDGMVYYTTQSSLTLQQIAANFSNSPESQALYGASTLSGVIDSIYMNLFNRHAEPGGLLYWSQQIASGAITPAFAAYAILIGAQNQDAVTVANKLEVATDWLAHLDTSAEITGYAGADAAQSARTFLATVDSTTASVTNAETNLDNAIAAAVNASTPGPLNVAISSPTIVEGNTGTKELAYVVTLSHASATPVTVSYTTGGGTATAGDDYQATAGSITFQPGQTTAVVNVTVFGDITVENDETVGLTVTGSTIGNSGVSATGTITNDDVNPVLTTGIDTIDVVGTGVNTIKGIVDGGTPANSTFSNGDTINGNGQTILQLLVSAGGTGAIAFVNGVSEVDVIAGAAAAIKFNAIEWNGVGSVNLSGGVSGATLTIDSLADTVNLGIGSTVGGTVAANYQDGLGATLVNSGKGGASFNATAGDVTVHLNTDGASGGAFFSSSKDVTLGNAVIDGGANSVSAFYGATSAKGVTVGDVTVTVGDSSSNDVFLSAGKDIHAGAIEQAAGDSAAAFLTVSATGDITIASVAQNVGASALAQVLVDTSLTGGGDIVIGGIAQVAGTSGFASISVDGSGDITLGDLTQQVGSGSSASAEIHVYDAAGGNITVGNVMQGAGNYVSMSVSTTGTGTVTVGDITQGASSSDAYVYINTDLGSIHVGNVDQTVGDSATASVSLDVRSFGTSVTSVADITVGTITQVGGDSAVLNVDLTGAGATTSSGATLGGNLDVGGVSQQVGDSGSMNVTLTSTWGGDITVGNISQVGGDSATASVLVSGSADVTVGNVTMSIGDATDNTARLQIDGSGEMTVGNVDVSVGNGSFVHAWATIVNDNGGDLTVGDVTIGAGNLTTSAGTSPQGYFGAFNENATGDLHVGNVEMNLGLTATGSITVSQTAAASGDGGSVTVGDVNVSLADKAILHDLYIHNSASVFTSTSHTTMNSLGDLTVGDINIAMGTNASASVTISQLLTGTTTAQLGGDVGLVHVGNIDINADVNAYADVNVFAANYVGGDMAGVEIGDVSFVMNDGGAFTFQVTVSDTSGSLDHFSMGNFTADLGVSGNIDNFTVDVRAGSIGDATIGDVTVTLGEHAVGSSMEFTISASTGDIGTVTIGDINLNIGQSASLGSDVTVDIVAAGNIGTVDIGKVVHIAAAGGGAYDTTTAFLTVSAGGDIGQVHVGGLQETLGKSASGDGMYLQVLAGGHIGSVTVDGIVANLGVNSVVSDIFQLSVTGTSIDSVNVGNEMVTLGAGATRSSYDNVTIDATAGNVGAVTFGDIVYHLGKGAGTSHSINRSITATGDIGSITLGDVGMYAATSAAFNGGFYLSASAGGKIGDVTVGDVTLQGTSASASMTAQFNITAASTINSVTFGDIKVAMSSATGYVTVDVNGTDIGGVTLGNLAVTDNLGGYAEIVLNIATTATPAATMGDLNVGDVSVHLSGGTASITLNVNAVSASGNVTIGDIDMGLVTTGTTPATGGFGHFELNADAVTGDVSVGTVSFNGTTAATLSVDLEVTGAADVALGIDVKGTGSFAGGDYVLKVNAGAADITINTIKMEDAGANNLANVLAGVTTTGTITLGTVDYSNHTGGAAIDVSPYAGNIHVIGSAGNDVITSNTGSDVLTGGAGTDQFVITSQQQDLATLTAFHSAKVETITDFKAGPTFAETITVDAEHTDVAHYSEKAASTADAAFTLALQTISDPLQQADVVAVQVGGDTYVFVDTDGDNNNIDQVIHLVGVQTSALNFADFNVV